MLKALNSWVSLPGLDYTIVSGKLVKQINPVYLTMTENRTKRAEMYLFLNEIFAFKIWLTLFLR